MTEELHDKGSQLGPLSEGDKVLPEKKRGDLRGESRTEWSRWGAPETLTWGRQWGPSPDVTRHKSSMKHKIPQMFRYAEIKITFF